MGQSCSSPFLWFVTAKIHTPDPISTPPCRAGCPALMTCLFSQRFTSCIYPSIYPALPALTTHGSLTGGLPRPWPLKSPLSTLALLCVPTAAVPVSPALAASLLSRAGIPLWPLQQVCIPCQWQERLSEASPSLSAPLSACRTSTKEEAYVWLGGNSVAPLLDASLT